MESCVVLAEEGDGEEVQQPFQPKQENLFAVVREGGSEGERERGREGARERGREGGRERGRDGGMEGWRE